MGVYIKGMEMPAEDEEIIIRISSDGTVMTEYALPITGVKAVPVPPHGRLIEKNAVFELIRSFPNVDRQLPVEFMKAIYELPTIIEAEEDE